MRSFIISILFLASTLSMSAQLEQGMISFNGVLNATQQWDGMQEQSAYQPLRQGFILAADPSFAYLISDHFMLGARIQSILISESGYTSDMTTFAPQVRYYFNPEGRTAAYAELSPGLNLNYFDGSHLDISLGVNQFIGEGLSLETSLNYSIYDGFDLLNYRLGFRPFLRAGTSSAAAPLGRGSLIMGGQQININYFDAENLYFEFSPQGGYFFADRTLFGLDGYLAFQAQREGILIQVHPYLRHYLSTQSSWVWFSSAGLMMEHERYGPVDWHHTNWTVMADVGTDLFLSSNLALEFKLIGGLFAGGSSTQTYPDNKVVEKADLGGISLGADISVKYLISKKQE